MSNENTGFSIIQAFLNFAELGAEWVMWLMLALGFAIIVVVVERLRLYLSTRIDAPRLARELVKLLDEGRTEEARRLVSTGKAM